MGRIRSILLAVSLAIASALPASAQPLSAPEKRSSSCFVQEVHTPFPEAILGDGLPKGFEVAPYDPDLPEMGDAVTTIVSCRQGSRTTSEEWVWTPTIPPRSVRSAGVKTYGWLIASLASDRSAFRDTARRCVIPMFRDVADFTHERQPHPVGGGAASRSTVVPHSDEGDYFDEVWTDVEAESAIPAKRIRMFGPSFRGFAGYDIAFSGGSTLSGSGAALQRAGAPSANGTTFAVPGTFPGRGFEIDDVRISMSSAGRSACGKG